MTAADAPSVTNLILRMKVYHFAIAQINERMTMTESAYANA